MREILFRAKRKDNQEWAEGYIVKHGSVYWIYTGELDEPNSYTNRYGITVYPPIKYMVDQSTTCQYTGLKDRKGKEIYEGDIVKCVDVNNETEFFAVVEFGNPNGFYSWGYQLRYICGDEPNLEILLWIDMEETGASCEIIGNIFDNPELLGGDSD